MGASRVSALGTEVNAIISLRGRLAGSGFGIWSGPPTGGWANDYRENYYFRGTTLMNDDEDDNVMIWRGPRPLQLCCHQSETHCCFPILLTVHQTFIHRLELEVYNTTTNCAEMHSSILSFARLHLYTCRPPTLYSYGIA